MIKIITMLLLVLLTTGCASMRTLGELPSKVNEYEKPLAELKTQYPDIVAYGEGIGYCTDIKEFIAKLGEPAKIETEEMQMPFLSVPLGVMAGGPGGVAVIAISYSVFPKQPKNYYWVKGDYLIRARVLTDFTCSYSNRVHMFEWGNKKL